MTQYRMPAIRIGLAQVLLSDRQGPAMQADEGGFLKLWKLVDS
jgi:hypothetical protein